VEPTAHLSCGASYEIRALCPYRSNLQDIHAFQDPVAENLQSGAAKLKQVALNLKQVALNLKSDTAL